MTPPEPTAHAHSLPDFRRDGASTARFARLGPGRLAGLVLLVGLVLLAVMGPWLAQFDPYQQDLQRVLESPSVEHPLGTDQFGRDVFARLAAAMRLSLGLAALSSLAAALMGSALGLLAAWRGGWLERILIALADMILALPGLLLVLLLAASAPGEFAPLYLGLSLALWVEYFRVVRAMSASILSGSQVEASVLLGFGPAYLVRVHLLPELLPVLGTLMSFGAATAVVALAALGFVGVGLQPPAAELGLMMIQSLPYYEEAPWMIAAPVAVLATFLAGLVLLAPARLGR